MGGIGQALREGARTATPPAEQQDLLAFVALALQGIAASVEATTDAWERRGYWLKADRFRQEWAWVDPAQRRLTLALLQGNVAEASLAASEIAPRIPLGHAPDHFPNRPWQRAWERFVATSPGLTPKGPEA